MVGWLVLDGLYLKGLLLYVKQKSWILYVLTTYNRPLPWPTPTPSARWVGIH